MSTPDLERAAQALRDSVAALEPGIRGPWHYQPGDEFVRTQDDSAVISVITDEEGAHIARTASPDVVTAVADLLDAISERESIADTDVPGTEWFRVARRAHDAGAALAAAILGGGADE